MNSLQKLMELNYRIIHREHLSKEDKKIFIQLLREQNKVTGDLNLKPDRCKYVVIVEDKDIPVAIGAIKHKTRSDFRASKANLPNIEHLFEWELGYLYTRKPYEGNKIASNIVNILIEEYGDGSLMASTEIVANPGMVKILERNGFKQTGNLWRSQIHENKLALYLKNGKIH